MSQDRQSRPPPPVLKRFQRLEMDGDPPPPKPPRRPSPARASGSASAAAQAAPRAPTVLNNEPADIVEARRLAAELTANAREMNAQATPEGRRTARAEQLRSRQTVPAPSAPRPPLPGPRAREMASGPVAQTFRFEVGQPPTMIVEAGPGLRPMPAPRRYEPLDLPETRTPGVVVMEVDLTAEARTRARDVDDGLGAYAPRQLARAERAPAPIELTPMAARAVKLMAWEAGLPGSGLRILTSWTPGLGGPECDFAFDDDVQPDDVVFLEQGVRVIVDRASLEHLRGRRITWHDVPGREGFAVR
ncbi:MAG: hypothetical protein U1F43_03290 [Myxococcota bacterium]